MAATTSQGKTFTLFTASITIAAAGVAYMATGMGKLSLIVGLLGLAIAFIGFLRIKPEEGKVPDNPQPALLRLIGMACAAGGWLVILFGLHLSSSVSGRMTTTLIGLALSLVGVIGILPAAANKNAIWKA